MSTGYNAGNAEEQRRLEKWYKQNKRRFPCPCGQPGAEMYIAHEKEVENTSPIKKSEKYIAKRMPDTGFKHDPKCKSYEPPPELSGLGGVRDSIWEIEPGITGIELGFSMYKKGEGSGRKGAEGGDSVKTDGNKLTFRAVLHYLWEISGLNIWSPDMEGKRPWRHIQRALLQSAATKRVKGGILADRLYIPEEFAVSKKDEIKKRRDAFMLRIEDMHSGKNRPLGLLIGKVKKIEAYHGGYQLTVKHVRDFHFKLSEVIHNKLLKNKKELERSESPDENLIVIATFTVEPKNEASIEEAYLMPTTGNWIPYEGQIDRGLIEELSNLDDSETGYPKFKSKPKRSFIKGLRYNLPLSKPLAFVVLTDTSPLHTAMYLQPPDEDGEFAKALKVLNAKSEFASWIWDTNNPEMPEVPPIAKK